MLKKSILTTTLTAILLTSGTAMSAMNHGGGNHGRKGGDKNGACRKVAISHIEPADRSKLKPEGEFTFWVSGVDVENLDLVEATAKKIPAKLSYKLVTNYYLFTGKLPADLKGSAARLNIKVDTKKCPTQKGVLYFIDREN
ncbi:MAG: hypothetical protein PSN04_10785 [Methyloprofundus sp.]|nr:hypothetical protein [Methyloprofundus sp.]